MFHQNLNPLTLLDFLYTNLNRLYLVKHYELVKQMIQVTFHKSRFYLLIEQDYQK